MKSSVRAKFRTTIPKVVREQLGIAVNDSLEWNVENGRMVVQRVHNNFLRYRGSVKTGAGDIFADIQSVREALIEKYQ